MAPYRSAGPSPTPPATSSTPPCAPSPRGRPASCTSPATSSPAATSHAPALTAERFVADPFGAPGQPHVPHRRPGPLEPPTANSSSSAAPTTRSRSAATASNSARSRPRSPRSPGVAQAAVVLREDHPGDQRLVAYVVTGRRRPGTTARRGPTSPRRLPDYMVPSASSSLDALPLTPNGKLDRTALPAPDVHRRRSPAAAPRTPREEILCSLFAEVLGVADGRHRRRLLRPRRPLPARHPAHQPHPHHPRRRTRPSAQLFEAPTVAGLAGALDSADRARTAADRRAPRPGAASRCPSPSSACGSSHQFEGPSATYNIPVAAPPHRRLDPSALRAALRTSSPGTRACAPSSPRTTGCPTRSSCRADDARHVPFEADRSTRRTLDAAAGAGGRGTASTSATEIPVRASLFRARPTTSTYCCCWSTTSPATAGPVARSPATSPPRTRPAARAAHPTGHHCPSSTPTTPCGSARSSATRPTRTASPPRQLAYWKQTLAGLPEQLDLPTDRPRPAVAVQPGGRVPFARRRRAAPAAGRAGPATPAPASFMVLQAALAALLTRLGAGTDIPIGTPVAGRTDDATRRPRRLLRQHPGPAHRHRRQPDLPPTPRPGTRTPTWPPTPTRTCPSNSSSKPSTPTRSLSHHPLFQVMLSAAERRTQPGSDARRAAGRSGGDPG